MKPQIQTANGPVDVIVFVPAEDTGFGADLLDAIFTPSRDRYVLNQHTQLQNVAGTAGQNSPDPRADFVGHQWVRYEINGQMRWLDPSYGLEYTGANDDAKVSDFEDKALYGFRQADLDDLELKLNADLDGDGNITNDAGTSPDFIVKQIVVRRQQDGVKEANHSFYDY